MSSSDLPVIAAYWVGPYLSWVEQLGLLSFVKHGHKVVLYTRGKVKNVPDGVEVRPAQDIYDGAIKIVAADGWPPPSLAINADIFKWHLQRQTDYIYADADIFCLQPISIFSQENFLSRGAKFHNTRFFRMIKGSPAVELICELLDEEFPIFPWWSAKEQKRRQRHKRENRGWSITTMKWGVAGDNILWFALDHIDATHPFDAGHFFHVISDAEIPSFFSLPAEEFERSFLLERHHAMRVSQSQLFWQRDKLFKDIPEGRPLRRLADDLAIVPEHSWLGRLAAEFDIDPAAAPLVKTRRQNHYHVHPSSQQPISVEQDMDLPVIAAYWVGPYLSWIEQLGLLSFVKQGHKVILYTRGEVKNVPEGVEVRPAQAFYDGAIKTAWTDDGWPPNALGVNVEIFKWYLQRQTDYIYADANVFCLQPVSTFSLSELHAGAIFAGSHVFRMPKYSRTTQCVCEILDQEYPIFPWHNRIKRMRRRFYKLIGRGKPIAALVSDIDEDKLMWRALSHTGEAVPHVNHFCVEIWGDDTRDLLFLPAEEFEGRFLYDTQKTMLRFSSRELYRQFGSDFKNVPQHSWLGRAASALGVDPSKAPLVETRLKNNAFSQGFLKRR